MNYGINGIHEKLLGIVIEILPEMIWGLCKSENSYGHNFRLRKRTDRKFRKITEFLSTCSRIVKILEKIEK